MSDGDAPPTAAEHPDLNHLVVIGASAGGVEALSVVLSGLRDDFPAPVVLAQHLDPTRPSYLHTILQRRTALPVHVVDTSTKMEVGTVYVVPANRHVMIRDGHVSVESDHGERPRPNIDLLLSTAARYYGERLIAVILTGSGSDGAAGAVEVKDGGGTVIIQNPLTARYPSMPSALPPTAVDHVADVENIAALLEDLARAPAIAESHPKAKDVLQDILSHVTRSANIDFRPYKAASLLRRIGRRMAVTHNTSLDEYSRYLEGHQEEVAELVMALLIKVTEFFRDPEAFLFLRNTVLPEVLEKGRARGKNLRLWSAGCATGEEAYSLILNVADALGSELPEWNVRVFATDLDEQAIGFARRGLYPANLLRNVPPEFLSRYFENADHGMRIIKPLRQMVIFGQQDLGRGVPFPRIDLVTCRNLLIYFQPELQQEVLDLFAYSLHATNGYLFLGKAETARPSKSRFELVNKKWKVYRCLSGPMAGALNAAATNYSRTAEPVAARPSADRPPADAVPPALEAEVHHVRRFTELMLRHMPVGAVVIDRSYRMMATNAAARRFLQIRDPGGDADFLHSVRGIPYAEVRAAIDSVFRDRAVVSLGEVGLPTATASAGRFVHITISPMIENSLGDLVLVTVLDATDVVQTKHRLETAEKEQKVLLDELGTTNKRLSDANKDLADANEELQAANEELMLAQEELQATNEEFEATNEELQATNEELETNNEELQATNEELETTNEELTARSSELQELTKQATAERERLSEVFDLAPFHVLLLRGPALLLEAFNPSIGRLLRLEGAIDRPVEELLAESPELVEGIRTAFRQGRVWTSDSGGLKLPGTNDAYRFIVVPRREDGGVEGVVVYVEEVSPPTGRAPA